jgi:hypothetical protein
MSHQHNNNIFVHSKNFYYRLRNIVSIISSFLNLILRVIAEVHYIKETAMLTVSVKIVILS